jgi:hypothetical protein
MFVTKPLEHSSLLSSIATIGALDLLTKACFEKTISLCSIEQKSLI